jgi:hypothetical protein
LSSDGTVEVCHIETSTGKKARLEKEKKKTKRVNKKTKGKTDLKKGVADSIVGSDEEIDKLESGDDVDGNPGKKRKYQKGDEEYRPVKKARME